MTFAAHASGMTSAAHASGMTSRIEAGVNTLTSSS